VETARLAEHQALDAAGTAVRGQEATALAGAGAVTAVIVLVLCLVRLQEGESKRAAPVEPVELPAPMAAQALSPMAESRTSSNRAATPVLKAAARLCTDFGCVRDVNDLQVLLARAGDAMDAAGLVVWLGNTAGAELQPVLTHGYNDEVRARLPSVPRSGDNAAAAAYRSRQVQIVLSRPGGSSGAIVAPIVSAEGCIGALSAEIRGGGEVSEGVQALAEIIASQLASVLATNHTESPERRAAASRS